MRRPDSIGKAIPHAEILVLRPDGSTVRCRRTRRAGAPRIAGRRSGYWNDPDNTAERFKSHTGRERRAW